MSHPRVLTTPAPRRSFPLPQANTYFTGELFDRIALFLHKHDAAFTTIECVARGVDKGSAMRAGAVVCVCVVAERGVGNEGDGEETKGVVGGGQNAQDGEQTPGQDLPVETTASEHDSSHGHTTSTSASTQTVPEVEAPGVQLETVEQRTSAYTSRLAFLFAESDIARTIPAEIRTVEFVSVVVHEDGKVDL